MADELSAYSHAVVAAGLDGAAFAMGLCFSCCVDPLLARQMLCYARSGKIFMGCLDAMDPVRIERALFTRFFFPIQTLNKHESPRGAPSPLR